jgi:hypothetical protein
VDVLIVDPGEHVGEPCLRIDVIKLGRLADLVAGYGHLVVDECHHLSAVSFETVARALKAKYVLGLSATVTRKDGHHPIIFMQCGPIPRRREEAGGLEAVFTPGRASENDISGRARRDECGGADPGPISASRSRRGR